jgi:hypothetical protein
MFYIHLNLHADQKKLFYNDLKMKNINPNFTVVCNKLQTTHFYFNHIHPSMLSSALNVMSQVVSSSLLHIFSCLQTILYLTNLPGLAGLPFIDDPDSALESSECPFKGCLRLLQTLFTNLTVKY